MPTKIFLKGGASVTIKGDSLDTAILKKFLSKWITGIAINGHEIRVNSRDILAYEFEAEGEFKARMDEAQAKEIEAKMASHCRRCGKDSPKEYSFCPNCSAPLVKKEESRLVIPGKK